MQFLFVAMLSVLGQVQVPEYLKGDDVLKLSKSFKVVVEHMDDDSPITEQQIQTDDELRLRSLGLEVADKDDEDVPAYLYVNVNALKIHESIYAYNIHIGFKRTVALQFDLPIYSTATIWGTRMVGGVGKNRSNKGIRNGVKEKADQFANAWIKTHPVKRDK